MLVGTRLLETLAISYSRLIDSSVPLSTSGLLSWEDISSPLVSMGVKAVQRVRSHHGHRGKTVVKMTPREPALTGWVGAVSPHWGPCGQPGCPHFLPAAGPGLRASPVNLHGTLTILRDSVNHMSKTL